MKEGWHTNENERKHADTNPETPGSLPEIAPLDHRKQIIGSHPSSHQPHFASRADCFSNSIDLAQLTGAGWQDPGRERLSAPYNSFMKDRRLERWLRDVNARQRNVVFPDTAANESRFWRNIISGKEKLHATQIVGIALIYMTLAVGLYGLISTQMQVSGIQGTLWERIWGNFGVWIIVFGVTAVFLLTVHLISHYSRHPRKSPGRFHKG
jgi:hypothetical protein